MHPAWCGRRDLNPQSHRALDFKSSLYANSSTTASMVIIPALSGLCKRQPWYTGKVFSIRYWIGGEILGYMPMKGASIMAEKMSLCRAKAGERLIVVSVDCEPDLRRRMYDLGITEGCRIRQLYSSVFGDPKAYLVRGSMLGIRDRDAERILCIREAL